MKKLVGNQKNCFMTMASLIFVCEILLRIESVGLQIIGVCLTPFIVLLGILFMTSFERESKM